MTDTNDGFTPVLCVVDFHHARYERTPGPRRMRWHSSSGPEVERWIGVDDGHDLALENDWSLLPFLALPDGSHLYVYPDFERQPEQRLSTTTDRPRSSPTSRLSRRPATPDPSSASAAPASWTLPHYSIGRRMSREARCRRRWSSSRIPHRRSARSGRSWAWLQELGSRRG